MGLFSTSNELIAKLREGLELTGIFPQVPKKIIEQMREELAVAVPCPLPVDKESIGLFSYAAEGLSLNPRAEKTDLAFCLRMGAAARDSILLFDLNDAKTVELKMPSVSARCPALIGIDDVTTFAASNTILLFDLNETKAVKLDMPAVSARCAALISLDDVAIFSEMDRFYFAVDPQPVSLVSESALAVVEVVLSSFSVRLGELPPENLVDLACECRCIDITEFQVFIKRFSFAPSISDQSPPLFAPQDPTKIGLHVPRLAERPEPPPPEEKPSLQDRLHALLFPPIEELLSDPQLALPYLPRPFQVFGIKWLHDRNRALLADEMGLGKTMQAIIAARLLLREGAIKRILIVCPKPLISNWRKELRTWWPGIECYTKTVSSNRRWFLLDATKDAVVKIINYEALGRELDWMKDKPPFHDLIIIDEAQRIKNAKSKNAQAVKALKSAVRWALTGTPVENSQKDLVSIFGFVKAGLINDRDSLEMIRNRTKPYILRRKQEEVLKDLPAMIDQDVEVELGERQREEYDRLEEEGVNELNQKGEKISVMHVFTLISNLRRICNFDSSGGESAKAELICEELKEVTENDRKALVFGVLVQEPYGLKRLAKVLSPFEPLELHGGVPQKQRDHVLQVFEKDHERNVLLLNYAVGGVGLNLQAANYVFLFDRWWNPAVEDQAVKRAHRLGQKLPVFVKRLYCKDTIEERILKKIAEKRRIFSYVIDDNRPPADAFGLSEEELFGLFKGLKVRPARVSAVASKARVIMENMEPRDFETLVAKVYEQDGYAVQHTGKSHDGGIDIIAEREIGGGRDRVIIQCKRQKDNVGRPIVQQLWGVLSSDQAVTRCDVVTSSDFTPQAKEFAKGKRITLVNGKELEERADNHGLAHFDAPTDS